MNKIEAKHFFHYLKYFAIVHLISDVQETENKESRKENKVIFLKWNITKW